MLVEVIWADGRREHVAMETFGEYYVVPRWTRACAQCGRPHIDGRVVFKRELIHIPEGFHGPFESHVIRDPDVGPDGVMVRFREELPS